MSLDTEKLIIILFLFMTGSAVAQTDFRPGFIVTNTGDSITGEIDYRGDLTMGQTCRFRIGNSSEIKEYSPTDLAAFRFTDGKYFVSREIDTKNFKGKAFLKFLINGNMDVYYFRSEAGDLIFVEKEGTGLVELPFERTIKHIRGTRYAHESSKHKGILKSLTADAPEIHPRIEKLRQLDSESIVSLAKSYHNKVNQTDDYILYEKDKLVLSVSVEPLFGYTKYKDANNLIREAGANLFFWLPQVNEKIYIKTGYFLQNFTANRKEYRINKVPLQFQYLYPKGKLRPKANLGVNYYLVFIDDYWISRFYTLHLGTGAQYQIYKKIYLSTNISSEFEPLTFKAMDKKPQGYFNAQYTFNFGIYIGI